MAKQDAIQDSNLYPALIGHSGTAGTADTIRLVANSAGALNIVGASAGTSIEIVTGTLGSILGIGGTVQVSGASAGTVVEVNKGTITTGTIGLVTRVGNIGDRKSVV